MTNSHDYYEQQNLVDPRPCLQAQGGVMLQLLKTLCLLALAVATWGLFIGFFYMMQYVELPDGGGGLASVFLRFYCLFVPLWRRFLLVMQYKYCLEGVKDEPTLSMPI